MISGISDLYVLCLGLLYPSYKMLQAKENSPDGEREFWQKYFIVFSVVYVSSQVLEMSLYMIIPLITLTQVIGVSLLVLPKTRATDSLYGHFILPFYETHKTFITEKLSNNYMSTIWTRYVNLALNLFTQVEDGGSRNEE